MQHGPPPDGGLAIYVGFPPFASAKGWLAKTHRTFLAANVNKREQSKLENQEQ